MAPCTPAAPLPPPTLLLTGFDPFGGDTANPSLQIAQALQGQRIAGLQVQAQTLPTVFATALPVLEQALARWQPRLVVCLGQAGGRAAIGLERVGINLQDARIPDNVGAQPIDTPVVPGGPAAYFATLPVKAMRQAVLRAGVPCELSYTAGSFVCNHVLYGLLHHVAQQAPAARPRAGFIHVPWLPGQGEPCLPLATMVRGVYEALWAAALQPHDLAVAGGTLH
ncbi:pyroglutamyl-peptidase I [Acidovorax lacteus]|uniref:Pyrrolidone-carboxylate peptidase n=1 Tax=Acidovorax lacteus TaxID=1924988 RepID=A0ABP8LIZ5_9BURK